MNLANSKTSKSHVLIFNLSNKIDLRRGEKKLLHEILVFTIHGKAYENHTTIKKLKYQLLSGMINLN